MATETKATSSELTPYRVSVRQFEQMIGAGVFPECTRVELIGGILVEQLTKNDPHDAVVSQLAEQLRRVLPPGWVVREEKSVVLGNRDRPEPDLAVARGQPMDYFDRAPRQADLAMIVEVADTSYAKDRGPKCRLYARAGVTIYWIVNLARKQIEVYSGPTGAGSAAGYRDETVYPLDGEVPVMIHGKEVGRILVRDVLR